MARAFCAIMLVCLLVRWAMPDTPASSASAAGPTMANFQAVRLGMVYPEVVRLLGPPSYQIYENVGGPLPSFAYAWHINGALPWTGAHIQVMFEHGLVTQKSQNGLR